MEKENMLKDDNIEIFDIWDLDNPIIRSVYNEKNYECIDTKVDSNLCYIFFSSNGLYYPNNKKIFEEQIIKKNRYEWKWVAQNSRIFEKAARIIFVRDIYKKWYSNGINSCADTVDKTIEVLRNLTDGLQVVTIGSSAGGYMATLVALKLNASYCINFSGQYRIANNLGNPYYDLQKKLDSYQGYIFYFVPAHSQNDIDQYKLVQKKECVKTFLFNDDKHASTMLTGNMPYIIENSKEELLGLYDRYKAREINKIQFLLYTVPIQKVIGILSHEIKGFIIRKSGKHWNGV